MASDRDIQISALRIFLAVADADTLTNAAKQLGITQSAVSQAIAQLEQTTGTDLVVRRSRPIQLTPAGNVLKRHAERLLERHECMMREVSRTAAGELPRLSIGAIDSFVDAAGRKLMDRIVSLAPELSLQTGLTMPLTEALLNRNLDILISSDPLRDHSDLECHPILRDPFVVMFRKDLSPSADLTMIRSMLPFTRYSRQTRLGMLTDLALRRASLDVESRYEFDSTHALMRTVHLGQGWAIATALCAMQFPHLLPDLHLMPLSHGGSSRYLCLVARRGELGELPGRIAAICREIHDNEILPRMLEAMPWLDGQADTITEMPQLWSA